MRYDQLPLYLVALAAGAAPMALAGVSSALLVVVLVVLATPAAMMVMEHRLERATVRHTRRRAFR